MYRWISLKIIDGEEKIIKSIEKNLEIEILENKEIQSIIENIKKDNDFNINYKDIIISKIVETAEKISNKVCMFEDKDYSERDRKIDKILTSKNMVFQ